jgi:putative transposase
MDLESTVRKSKKIKICLNQVQRNLIKRWVGTSRFVFNETVKYLQQPGSVANWKAIKTEIIHGLPEWSKDIPYQIKSIAIKDACLAVKEAKKKYKQTGKINKVKFRSRRDKIQSCYIPKSAVTDKGIYHTKLGSIRFTEKLPTKIGDCRLVSHLGITYLSVPHDVPHSISENQGRVVALDPGVRSFMTLFSETSFGWLGQYDMGRIQRLCYYLDGLISRSTKVNAKKRYRMRKAANKIRFKIKNLVDELHHKIARFLVDNFDIILLPTFETSQMTIKKSRKIRAKSVRQMLTLSHYRFKQFLKHKAFETGKLVLDVNEAYTSKTVSWTGEIIYNLGGRKKIKSSDGRVMDRDLNGGRGIFLRSLVDNPSLLDCIVNVS